MIKPGDMIVWKRAMYLPSARDIRCLCISVSQSGDFKKETIVDALMCEGRPKLVTGFSSFFRPGWDDERL